jgi:hypothetical protein
LGGDFYDAVQTEDGHLRVIVGDVTTAAPATSARSACASCSSSSSAACRTGARIPIGCSIA